MKKIIMKQIISAILALVLIIRASPAVLFAGSDYFYDENSYDVDYALEDFQDEHFLNVYENNYAGGFGNEDYEDNSDFCHSY